MEGPIPVCAERLFHFPDGLSEVTQGRIRIRQPRAGARKAGVGFKGYLKIWECLLGVSHSEKKFARLAVEVRVSGKLFDRHAGFH